jgi:hypothetical protein
MFESSTARLQVPIANFPEVVCITECDQPVGWISEAQIRLFLVQRTASYAFGSRAETKRSLG